MTAPASLQSRLAVPDGEPPEVEPAEPDPASTIEDPVGLFQRLETNGRFRRDRGLGRIYHPGKISLRENRPADSLHISIDGNRIAAHVDEVSPLDGSEGARYSFVRVAAHNASGMAADVVRVLRGRQGDHRCELDCWWEMDPAASDPDETAQHLLDPQDAPWSVQLEAKLAIGLDGERLRAALSQTVDLDTLDVVDCPDQASLDTARAEFQVLAVPLDRWPPLRARLARGPDGHILMLNLNHAASDGFGALRVLRCIARTYAGDPEACDRTDFLALRDLPVRPASARVSSLQQRYRNTMENLRDRLNPPAHLVADPAGQQDGFGFHLMALSVTDSLDLNDVGADAADENDLLAALHLAIAAWNTGHDAPAHKIGVLVSADLRPPRWQQETVANLSVTSRVSTSRRHRNGPTRARRAVGAETARNQRSRTGVALIAALHRSGLLALWAKQSVVVLQPLTGNLGVDTALLCDLGRIEDPPDFGPDAGETLDLWFSAPARIPSGLSVGAVTVGARLHLVFRYPRRLFSPDAARRFAESYRSHLRVIAASR